MVINGISMGQVYRLGASQVEINSYSYNIHTCVKPTNKSVELNWN